MRTLKRLGLAAGAWVLVVAAFGPAHADGLSKFNEQIKAKLPPDTLKYKSAKALGDNGFELDDVIFTPPPDATGGAKAEPVKIKSITVDELDFDSVGKQAPPNFLKMRIEGVDIGEKPAEGVDLKAMTGLDKLSADFQFDYRIDPAKKTLTVNRVEINLNGLARLEMSMVLDNISLDDAAQPDKAMNETTLRTASLVYDDRSLLSKTLPAGAKAMQGSDPGVLIAMAKGVLDGMRAGQGEPTQKAFDAIESYMEDYKAPKGPLRLTFSPPPGTTAASVTGAAGPDAMIKALGLKVDYAGTRKQEVKALPAAPGGVGDAAKKPKDEDEDDDDATKDVTKSK